MILETIWSIIFSACAVGSAFMCSDTKDDVGRKWDAGVLWWYAFLLCAGVALAVSWPLLWEPLLAALDSALPQHGTPIHAVTAYVLVGLACSAYLVLTYLAGAYAPEIRRTLRRGRPSSAQA